MIINQITNPLYALFWIYEKYRGLLIRHTLEGHEGSVTVSCSLQPSKENEIMVLEWVRKSLSSDLLPLVL